MNILITGGAGMLGHLLVNYFKARHRVIYTVHREQHDISGAEQISWDLTRGPKELPGIDVAIHTAAMTNVDDCEKDPRQAYLSNVVATRNVAVSVLKAYIIYISTDFVYDGSKGNYSEEDIPSPLSVYGQTKLEGESQIPPDGCIIRASIYGLSSGPHRPGMLEKLLDRLNKGEKLTGFTDQIFTPISTENLAIFLEEIIDRRLSGIINIGSSQPYTKYEFIRTATRSLGYSFDRVIPGLSSSVNYLALRPRDTSLDTSKARGVLKTNCWDLERSFRSIKRALDGRELWK